MFDFDFLSTHAAETVAAEPLTTTAISNTEAATATSMDQYMTTTSPWGPYLTYTTPTWTTEMAQDPSIQVYGTEEYIKKLEENLKKYEDAIDRLTEQYQKLLQYLQDRSLLDNMEEFM